MDRLTECAKILDEYGLDVMDVGCKWMPDESPTTFADGLRLIVGILVLYSPAIALLWFSVWREDRLKPPSS